jgi:hypothetical protein
MSDIDTQDEFKILAEQERQAQELVIQRALDTQERRLKRYLAGGTVEQQLTTPGDKIVIGRAIGRDRIGALDKRIAITDINNTTISTEAFTITPYLHPTLGKGINIMLNSNQRVWMGNQRQAWDVEFPYFIKIGDSVDADILVGYKNTEQLIRKLHRLNIETRENQDGTVNVKVSTLNTFIKEQ